MKIKKFTDLLNESNVMSFDVALSTYIVGQKVKGPYSVPRYGTKERPYYGDGLFFENGYKYISYGGGCSGEDCNTSYIIGPDDVLISQENW